jgi:transcriptional regulator with GAF, ATPase, and Fis domain
VTYRELVWVARREILVAALREAGWNRTRAAQALGLQRTHMQRLIREHGLASSKPERRSKDLAA